ncbi:MAG: DUF4258 domain-containing protein [Terrimonas sp.]|nr:DUF4258 domain-containing protein [Terrimonas sp.]
MNRKVSRLLTGIALLVIGLLVWQYYPSTKQHNNVTHDEGFNRNLMPIIYTKQARCRMGCRHIDEDEVKQILLNGRINYKKSQLNSKPDPKYALEGYTADNQHVRIIFAPSQRGMVVITVIDVNEEWQCDCK